MYCGFVIKKMVNESLYRCPVNITSDNSTETINWLLSLLGEMNHTVSRNHTDTHYETPIWLDNLKLLSFGICACVGVYTIISGTRSLYNRREQYSTPIEAIRYYSNRASICHTMEKYYKNEIDDITGFREIIANNAYSYLDKNKYPNQLESRYPRKTIERQKKIAIKNWVVSYFELNHVFSLKLYKKHMRQFNIDFEDIKREFTNKDFDKINKVFKEHRSECNASIFFSSARFNISDAEQLVVRRKINHKKRLLKQGNIELERTLINI